MFLLYCHKQGTPSRPPASVIDPSGEGKIEKEDLMKDDEAEEVSGWMRIGQSLLPKQMNNLGIHRRKRVKISSKEQSVWYKFVFGILLSIVIYEFCQLLLPALKMTPKRVETC